MRVLSELEPKNVFSFFEDICNIPHPKWGVEFLYRDFRPEFRGGQQQARELGLYMQKYCGCIFSEEDRYAKQIARDLAIPLKHFPTK